MKPILNLSISEKTKWVKNIADKYKLHSICVEGNCPNREKCFQRGNITFMILGDTCTRNCTFCSVNKGKPQTVDPMEANNIAEAIAELKPHHIVVTSVTRDDLSDGGASQFYEVARKIKEVDSDILLELLVPDFKGDDKAFDILLEAPLDIFGHNLETVDRLYPILRPMADYSLSLSVLERGAKHGFIPKTGIMVGCGESVREVEKLMKEVVSTGCKIITIGQYLQPSKFALKVKEYIDDKIFSHYREYGASLGLETFSAPLVRSSYIADLSSEELKTLKEWR